MQDRLQSFWGKNIFLMLIKACHTNQAVQYDREFRLCPPPAKESSNSVFKMAGFPSNLSLKFCWNALSLRRFENAF